LAIDRLENLRVSCAEADVARADHAQPFGGRGRAVIL
jgi:hypothetical protein